VNRLPILVIALLVGAAAPARAWCEATCLEPAVSESAKPHCPSHEPTPAGPSLSAAGIAECPSIESARPVLTKLNFAVAVTDLAPHARAPRHHRTSAPLLLCTPALLHPQPIDAPLRL
jgi:hypothetical protein